MPEELTCPVCGLEHISVEKVKCPQCDADLSCFKVLDSLPEEAIREKSIHGIRLPVWVFIVLFFGLIAVIITNQYFWFRRFKILLRNQQSYLTDSMRSMVGKLEGLTQRRPEQPNIDSEAKHEEKPGEGNLEKGGFWIYRVLRRDTLWSISKRYYGSGHYYPVLLDHNPHLNIYTVQVGSRVRILSDAGDVEDEYARITAVEGGKTYLDYTVREGDTLDSIARKFYRTGPETILKLNPRLRLEAGESVRIFLD
jgi:LysM repeat protein